MRRPQQLQNRRLLLLLLLLLLRTQSRPHRCPLRLYVLLLRLCQLRLHLPHVHLLQLLLSRRPHPPLPSRARLQRMLTCLPVYRTHQR